MALFRKLFYRKPPDGLLEISERVYVFDCCFTTDAWEAEEYKTYVRGVMGQLRDYFPDASILVFNFREGGVRSQIANALYEYDMTIMDYPRQYEGCPLLPMEVIHHFLRSGESWLSLGHQNVLLMHCERGGWPVLAFMLAALLIYSKQYSGEQKTLDMIYKQAPRELLHFLSPLNPIPSQLRYLQYVSRRNVATEWPPLDRALTLDCIIIRMIPNFDGEGGCRPIVRIYGQDPLLVSDRNPKLLFSTPKRGKAVRHYKKAECELVKIDINCNIQGDVVLECINLHDDMEREAMILRVMFNTAFIRSNILMLNRNDIDMVWDSKDQFPTDFRAEVLFSEMDAVASTVPVDLSCFEEKEGLPVEAFAKVQEIFNSVDWLVPKTDIALDMIQQITASNNVQEKLDSGSGKNLDSNALFVHVIPEKHQDGQSPKALENYGKSSIYFALEKQSVASPGLTRVADVSEDKAETKSTEFRNDPTSPSQLSPLSPPSPLQPSFSASATVSITSPRPPLPEKPQHLSTSESMHPSLEEQPNSDIHEGGQSLLVNQTAGETPSAGIVPKDSVSSPPPPSEGLEIAPSALPTPCLASEEKSVSGTRSRPPPAPPPPPTLPVKDPAIGIGQSSSSPPPQTPHEPQTPPLKDSTTLRIGTSPPPPPPLSNIPFHSLKDNTNAIIVPPPAPPPPPPPPPLTRTLPPVPTPAPAPPPPPPQTQTSTPIPLKNDKDTRTGPPPRPRTSLRDTFRAAPPPPPPPTPPLKENSPLRGRPPPPLHSGQALQTTNSASVPPPPPPVPSSSSKVPHSPVQNSLHVPSAPPPPAPSLGAVQQQSLSRGSVGQSGSPSPPPPFIPQSITKGRGPSRALTSRNNQTKKLKPLHWLKLTRAVQGSLWAETQKSGEASKAPEIDVSELESLFSAAVPNSSQGGKTNSRASVGNKPEIVQLIDHRRAYNCEIMLSKVKVPLHELMTSVLALEDSALDADQVDNLIKFCPTKEDMELLKNYEGEKDKLGKCEQFFLELMQVPRTESKLRVFSFKMQFRSQVSDLRNSLDVVNSTAEQIRSSVKLKKVMQTILSLGNALNQGTARGSAVGFRLDSLLKLTETRARNNKMTLMHYLCKVLADKLPELLDFSKDLGSLEPASKIQLKFLAEEMQAINKGLEKVVQELSLSESDGPVSEYFRKALKEFLCFAEGEVRSLASLYSVVGRNVDALILYFGEDPSRCTFEQVVSTLLNFVRMFNKSHEENCKQLEADRKKAEKEAASEQTKMNASHKGSELLINSPIKSVK